MHVVKRKEAVYKYARRSQEFSRSCRETKKKRDGKTGISAELGYASGGVNAVPR